MHPLAELKAEIESLQCPILKEHPTLELRDDGSMKLHCCCPEFKVQCYHILIKFLADSNYHDFTIQLK